MTRGAPQKHTIPFTVHRTVPGMTGRLGIHLTAKMERLRLRNVDVGRVLNSAFQAERAPSNGGTFTGPAPINSLIYKWVCLELFHPTCRTYHNSTYKDPRGSTLRSVTVFHGLLSCHIPGISRDFLSKNHLDSSLQSNLRIKLMDEKWIQRYFKEKKGDLMVMSKYQIILAKS